MSMSMRQILKRRVSSAEGPEHTGFPASPLFFETFDTAVGYDLTLWTEVLGGGTINEDYTGVVLDGTQSLRLETNGGLTYFYRAVTDIGNIFLFFKFNGQFIPANSATTIITVSDSVGVVLGRVELNGGVLTVIASAGSTVLSSQMSQGVEYNCWFEYNKNNGTNRIANFAFSTGRYRPTSGPNYGQVAVATSALDVGFCYFGAVFHELTDNVIYLYDYCLADNVQIGDNP